MNLKNFLDDIAYNLKNYPAIRKIFSPIYQFILKFQNKEKDRLTDLKINFDLHGIEAINLFDITLDRMNIKYSLAFGTLLGAVRNKGFISHDLDIDVFLWIEDFSPQIIEELQKVGFKLKHTFSVDNDKLGKEDTIEYKGVQIDIFYVYQPLENRKYPYCCDFFSFPDCRSRYQSIKIHGGLLPRRLEMPISDNVIKVEFENLKLPIIDNADTFLSFRYGKNYMTPDPKWRNGDNNYIIPWVSKVATYKEY